MINRCPLLEISLVWLCWDSHVKYEHLPNPTWLKIGKSGLALNLTREQIRGSHSKPAISMRAGPAFLQFDWSKAGLSMDLPVFVYSHTKTSFKFLSREDTGQLFMWLEIFYFKLRRKNLTGLLFCLDLSLSRSTNNRDRNLHSLSYRFQSSYSWVMRLGPLYFVFMSLNM